MVVGAFLLRFGAAVLVVRARLTGRGAGVVASSLGSVAGGDVVVGGVSGSDGSTSPRLRFVPALVVATVVVVVTVAMVESATMFSR